MPSPITTRARPKSVPRRNRRRAFLSGAASPGRSAAGVPWILRQLVGPAVLQLPVQYPEGTGLNFVFPDNWGQVSFKGDRWYIPRHRFTATAELVAERYGYTDVYMEFDESARCTKACSDSIGLDCVCSCLGAGHNGGIDPSSGWIHQGTISDGRTIEVHTTLLEGHSLDGMFV
ncbi:MAG TPA: hypothetical protein VF867_19935 [Arthrobacter sp.]